MKGFVVGYPKLSAPLQKAYEVAESSEDMVHASRGPKLQKRQRPDRDEVQEAYYVQLTTVGISRDIKGYVHKQQLHPL